MAQVTLNPADDVVATSSGLAAGLGPHLPIGTYSGYTFRSAIRFNAPSGFNSWTEVTAAELTFYIGPHTHVAPRNSTIYCKRQTMANLWTKGAGSQNCNSGFSGSNNTQYGDITPTSTDYRAFASGTADNDKKTISVAGIVRYYQDNNASVLVFVFEGADSGEYSELWAEGYGYNAKLVIDYEVESVPAQPTLVSPTASEVVLATKPTFAWDHVATQSDPQLNAEVQLYDAGGVAIGAAVAVAGATETLTWPTDLVRGTTYQYAVRTQDVTGWGLFSAKRTFSIKANPVVTVDATRYMEFFNGAPRLRVKWSHVGDPQTEYRVQTTSPVSDSTWKPGATKEYLLDTVDLVSGTATNVTVSVRTATGVALEGSGSRSFTPRWGLTTHRAAESHGVPKTWGVPSILPASQPIGTTLKVEYGSNTTPAAAPTAWYSDLSAVPLAAYLYYRAWFIPSATQGPTLDKIVLTSDAAVALIDKWGTTRGGATLAAPWDVAGGEYVYGTRSAHVKLTGTGETKVYSFPITVRQGRSYILTGLMKAEGNPGACFQLEDAAGNLLKGGVGILYPPGTDMRSTVLAASKDWFTEDDNDVYRYSTPIIVPDFTGEVHAVLRAQGTVGSQAWWDGMKLEESTVATPWSPAAIGATVIDAGGVQVDATKGGVLRYKGSSGGLVTGSAQGLTYGDVDVYSTTPGELTVGGKIVVANAKPIVRVYPPAASPWVKPAGLSHITVEVQGGGGQGGGQGATAAGQSSAAAGGGGGGYAKKTILASALSGTNYTVVVGAGGTGAGTGAAGNAGGLSSFAGSGITTVQGNGGAGGGAMAGSSATAGSIGGTGGTATGGDINIPGGNGGPGRLVTGSLASIAAGGGSVLSTATMPLAAAGTAGTPYGGGASGNYAGASTAASAGAAGAAGVVIVTEYYL